MIYKKINNSIVSAICYGGGDIKTDDNIKRIHYVYDKGVNFFDTSENYNDGMSEIILGKALFNFRKNVFISTKVAPEHLKYDDVIDACNKSLERLKTDYIDLYYVHWPNNIIPIEETCKALEYLLKCGKILNIGFCNFSFIQLHDIYNILDKKISALQYEYNFVDRSIEKDILPFSDNNNIPLVAFSPLRYMKYMYYDSDFILSWMISHYNIIAAMSSTKMEHIDKNLNIKIINLYEINYIKTKYIDLNLIDYKTNKNFHPVIDVLAKDIKKYGVLKPIKVIKENNVYKIIDGGLRFLSWKHAYKDKPIEAIILNNHDVPKT